MWRGSKTNGRAIKLARSVLRHILVAFEEPAAADEWGGFPYV